MLRNLTAFFMVSTLTGAQGFRQLSAAGYGRQSRKPSRKKRRRLGHLFLRPQSQSLGQPKSHREAVQSREGHRNQQLFALLLPLPSRGRKAPRNLLGPPSPRR